MREYKPKPCEAHVQPLLEALKFASGFIAYRVPALAAPLHRSRSVLQELCTESYLALPPGVSAAPGRRQAASWLLAGATPRAACVTRSSFGPWAGACTASQTPKYQQLSVPRRLAAAVSVRTAIWEPLPWVVNH